MIINSIHVAVKKCKLHSCIMPGRRCWCSARPWSLHWCVPGAWSWTLRTWGRWGSRGWTVGSPRTACSSQGGPGRPAGSPVSGRGADRSPWKMKLKWETSVLWHHSFLSGNGISKKVFVRFGCNPGIVPFLEGFENLLRRSPWKKGNKSSQMVLPAIRVKCMYAAVMRIFPHFLGKIANWYACVQWKSSSGFELFEWLSKINIFRRRNELSHMVLPVSILPTKTTNSNEFLHNHLTDKSQNQNFSDFDQN